MKSYKGNTTFRFATVLLFSLLAMASIAGAQLPAPELAHTWAALSPSMAMW